MDVATKEGRELYESILNSFQQGNEECTFCLTLTDEKTKRVCEVALTGNEFRKVVSSLKLTLLDWT